MAERMLTDPIRTEETAAFWDGTKVGKLLVKTCTSCGKAHWYPRTRCPFCFSDQTEWIRASGNGTVFSYSYMRRASPPYVMAYVTLDEGPTMMTNIVDCDPESLEIGTPVTVVFQHTTGGEALPMFTPRTGEKA